MLPGERKSGADGGARAAAVCTLAHQSMHHLVAEAAWSDEAMLSAVAGAVLPKLCVRTCRCTGSWTTRGLRRRATTRWGSRVSIAARREAGPPPSGGVPVDATAFGSLPVGYPLYCRGVDRRCGASPPGWRARGGWLRDRAGVGDAPDRGGFGVGLSAGVCWRMPPTATRRRGASNCSHELTYAGRTAGRRYGG